MKDEDIIQKAIDFFQVASDADSTNRSEAAEDLRFSHGDQWPVEIQNSRNLDARPCVTINKLDAYVRQICNQQRQQRPRMKADAMNTETDSKVAQVVTGICRHIENQSNADLAYDIGFESAVRIGFGYWRVLTDYTSPDSFDQDILIAPIDNPFTVSFDPNSMSPDGSDAQIAMISTMMDKKKFKKEYPAHADDSSFDRYSTGDGGVGWQEKENIRIAELFWVDLKPADLVQLSDGSSHYAKDIPSESALAAADITIINQRKSWIRVVKWAKLTSQSVIEQKEWVGKYIPIVPVYGQTSIIDGKVKHFGLTRSAKDPQRLLNYWITSATESVALAPRAKWIMAEGQNEGHETEWANANLKSTPVLLYKQTDIDDQPAPPPERLQPEPPPTGIMESINQISMDLQTVVGIMDPNQLPSGNISGKALQGQQAQMDVTNFHYYANLTNSIRQTGRIILDLIPKIYDTQRVMRIIGDDGKPELITVNEQTAVGTVLNDLTVGEYDITMETGPGYNSKRQEAVDSMMGLLSADPTLMQTAGDLIFRNMDFPGADTIADRLAAANPMAQIDDKSPIPPQAQMQLAIGKKQLDAAQQEIQQLQMQLKYRGDITAANNDTTLKVAHLNATVKAHDVETRSKTAEDTMQMRVHTDAHEAVIKSQTQIKVEHIKAKLAMLLASMDESDEDLARGEAVERAI